MIARVWTGAVPEAKGDRYLDYLNRTGVKGCRSTPGNRGVYVLRRDRDGRAEFTFVSLWESRRSIEAFAGPDIGKAVYYPEDREFLLEMSPGVEHFEVVAATLTE